LLLSIIKSELFSEGRQIGFLLIRI